MLDPARVVGGGLFVHAQTDQQLREHRVALVDRLRQLFPGIRQRDRAVFFHEDIPALAENAHRAGNAGLGIPKIFADVNGADIPAFLRQNQYSLKIHFTRFPDSHSAHLLFIRISHFPAECKRRISGKREAPWDVRGEL